MELKVWVEGIQRIVCGVTESTTCQDVVYALAHATGKTGRFTLIERWRNNERLLAPHENPLKILMKWGEYSNDVQLILQRSGCSQSSPQSPPLTQSHNDVPHGFSPLPSADSPESRLSSSALPERNKDIRKSLTFSGSHHPPGLAEVRRANAAKQEKPSAVQSPKAAASETGSISENMSSSPQQLTRGEREAPPYRAPPPGPAALPNRNPLPLPPYRDPPPPTQSPSRATPPQTTAQSPTLPSSNKPRRGLLKDFPLSPTIGDGDQPEAVAYNAQYRDLVRLINYQRDKLSSQQAEISKFDAEIVFWEGKTREQKHQHELIVQETMRMEAQARQTEEQLRALNHVEEDSELVRQQEKTLKSEITLLRSKLANCETELLQCKNKIRLLAEESQSEQRALLTEREDRHQLERSLLSEVERLQRQVDVAKQTSEQAAQCGDELRREVAALESAISDKKHQVEQLVAEMKEANLQSLAIAPADEIRHLLEGPYKPGSTRKMVGSPRQLENAVPTSKNPHGVWV